MAKVTECRFLNNGNLIKVTGIKDRLSLMIIFGMKIVFRMKSIFL